MCITFKTCNACTGARLAHLQARAGQSTPNPPHHQLKDTTRMETFLANQAQRPTRTISNWVNCVGIPCKHKQITPDPRHRAQGVIFQVQRNTGCSAQVCCMGDATCQQTAMQKSNNLSRYDPRIHRFPDPTPCSSHTGQCRYAERNHLVGQDVTLCFIDVLTHLHINNTQGKASVVQEIKI